MVEMAKSKVPSLATIIRIFHLYPNLGIALFGDGSTLAGAIAAMGQFGDPRASVTNAVREFYNIISISYTGFNPSTGVFHGQGYPLKTYLAHAAIEISARLAQRFGGRAMTGLTRLLNL